MIDEPEQNEPSPNNFPDRMTEEVAEKIKAAIDVIHELTEGMSPPMDPRAFGLLEMAADLLLEQIQTGRVYYPDNLEQDSSEINSKLNQIQDELKILQDIPYNPPKSLGDQMAEDIQKFYEKNDLLPDEEQ